MSESAQPISLTFFKLKLLNALKSNNYSSIEKLFSKYKGASVVEEAKYSIFHMAIQVSSAKLIEQLLGDTRFNLYVNSQDLDGNTPLHLACLNQRSDVVELLLNSDKINDNVYNKFGCLPIDMIRENPTMYNFVSMQRFKHIEAVTAQFKEAFKKRDFDQLEKLLSVSRNADLFDINALDPNTHETLLHEFTRKKDVEMVKWILEHGGDPFKRSKKGKLPIDYLSKIKTAGTSEQLRRLLKKSAKSQSSVVAGSTSEAAPTFRGYLKKWTNLTSGYKLRWFYLDSSGILSYYKSQDGADTNCRGSLNLKDCRLSVVPGEKLKFDILGPKHSDIKWHLKANHSIEAKRWISVLSNAIQIAKAHAEGDSPSSSAGLSAAVKEELSDSSAATAISGPPKRSMSLNSRNSKDSAISGLPKVHMRSLSQLSNSNASLSVRNYSNSKMLSPVKSSMEDDAEDGSSEIVDLGGVDFADVSSVESSLPAENENFKYLGVHGDELTLTKRAIQLELTSLIEYLSTEPVSPESWNAVIENVKSIYTDYNNFSTLGYKNNLKMAKRLKSELQVNSMWESQMQTLEEENALAAKRIETFETERKTLRKILKEKLLNQDSQSETTELSKIVGDAVRDAAAVAGTQKLLLLEETDSDDEFFDVESFTDQEKENGAMTAGETVVEQPELTTRPSELTLNEIQKRKNEQLLLEKSYNGYEDPIRTKLTRDQDDRPKISLWGILKSMVGKDMTKITLPVSFNECTSLLQRVAEGMEYSDLVTHAASLDDSALRMCYIAAFAASEYASTINRVAKPFNPLLGETFEYARPDKNYRFFIEQVSHHPPISAALAESPKWDYYGESAVKSKFNGRSFDIKPLGKWYLHLRPDNGVVVDGQVQSEELYTWNRITSSVVGIIVGNPVVDNYGEMNLENHMTGDHLILNFKARGWTAASAYEVKGTVLDKNNEPKYTIKGHWNSKIYYKKVGDESEPKLLWQVNPRPPRPFNLTLFSISLNAITPKLKEWIAPTDTRLRPDQRAMEDGRYDEASDEKFRVEEKQRDARKRREANHITYEPKFFEKSTHPTTKDPYWKFNGEYWKERAQHNLDNTGDIF